VSAFFCLIPTAGGSGSWLKIRDFLQPFNNLENRGTYHRILQCELCNLNHLFSIGMRILAAGFWAIIVNCAVVFRIEKRTWRGFEDVILVFINPQILVYKITWLHAKRLCNALNIGLVEDRTGSFAAVSTGEAIYLFKHIMVMLMKEVIHLTGVSLPKAGEKFSILLFFIPRL
jgi:hypothetical protein